MSRTTARFLFLTSLAGFIFFTWQCWIHGHLIEAMIFGGLGILFVALFGQQTANN